MDTGRTQSPHFTLVREHSPMHTDSLDMMTRCVVPSRNKADLYSAPGPPAPPIRTTQTSKTLIGMSKGPPMLRQE